MSDVFSMFGSFGGAGALLKLGAWFLVFLLVGAGITTGIVIFLLKKKTKKVIEINMQTRRMRFFSGRIKRKHKKIDQFWAQKIGRFLPRFQQQAIFTKGTQDTVLLLKDNNGLYHTARVPTHDELKVWYQAVHGIDLDELSEEDDETYYDKMQDIFLLPTPHEDLDWLANQCAEAEKEFNASQWWNSPIIAYVATGFICFMMIVVTIILEKKM